MTIKSELSVPTPLLHNFSISRESSSPLHADIKQAIEFFERSDVQHLVADLQRSVLDFISKTTVPLCAIDCQTERGNFVREGISPLLSASQERGENPLVFDRFGAVKIVAEGRELHVGNIFLSSNSPMLQQDFVNKTRSEHLAESAFQLEQVDSYTDLKAVLKGDPSGFVLSDSQSLAAEIVMTMEYIIAYAHTAGLIAVSEQSSDPELVKMKVEANFDDCLGAAQHLVGLESRIRELTRKISRDTMWAKLSGPASS
jgi:hypothetical protein